MTSDMTITGKQHGTLPGLLNPTRLTGPIFDKELRTSSRRRRNYLLRTAYVVILSLFIFTVWQRANISQTNITLQKSQMSEAGKTMISSIVVFQFFAAQLIAVIILSTSISNEIYNKTLGVLMTTPVTGTQIVMGKLLSKLFQIILLLAISLPLLAVVRIFGGVPWEYILSGLSITLTAVIFAGTLSLCFSISNKQAYVVIIKTLVVLSCIFLFIPGIYILRVNRLWYGLYSGSFSMRTFPTSLGFMAYFNPIFAMAAVTTKMVSPSMTLNFKWPLHCVLMLFCSTALIIYCIIIVRKVALSQITGQLTFKSIFSRLKILNPVFGNADEPSGVIKEVRGSAVVWKELRNPMIRGRDSKNSIIGFSAAILALLITYISGIANGYIKEDFVQLAYVVMFVIVGSIFHIVLSSMCITSEKDSHSWPILLATPMDDWYIILGKVTGVFYRCMPVWLLFAGHLLVFVIARDIHPVVPLMLFILVVGLTFILTGLGLYFSTLLKHTTSAVMASFGVLSLVWIGLSVVSVVAMFFREEKLFTYYISANPLVQSMVIMVGAGGANNALLPLSNLEFTWPLNDSAVSAMTTIRILCIYSLVYILCGFILVWRAKCRFRRKIF